MGIMVIALLMGLWTVVNWVVELRVWLKSKPMDIPEGIGFMDRMRFRWYGFMYHLNNFKYFALDVAVSWASITMFAFGESMMAGVMGMLFSNLLSCVIIARMMILAKHRKDPEVKHYDAYNDWRVGTRTS